MVLYKIIHSSDDLRRSLTSMDITMPINESVLHGSLMRTLSNDIRGSCITAEV